MIVVKEPERKSASKEAQEADVKGNEPLTQNDTFCTKLGRILKPFMAPSLILAILAGSVRNAGKFYLNCANNSHN
jgi:hypothetical protein